MSIRFCLNCSPACEASSTTARKENLKSSAPTLFLADRDLNFACPWGNGLRALTSSAVRVWQCMLGVFLLIRQDGKNKAAGIGASWCVCVSLWNTGSSFDINCKREVRVVVKSLQKGEIKEANRGRLSSSDSSVRIRTPNYFQTNATNKQMWLCEG